MEKEAKKPQPTSGEQEHVKPPKKSKPAESEMTLEEYKKYVAQRLEEFTPVFLKLASGDFSTKVNLPEKEDEFSPLVTAISMVLDDLKFLDQENKRRSKDVEERMLQIKKSREVLNQKTKELEDSRKALMNILEDVNEAKEQAEQERLKTMLILQNLTDGLIVFSQKGKIDMVNPMAEQFLNLSSQKMIGQSLRDLRDSPYIKTLIDVLGEDIQEVFRKEVDLGGDAFLEASSLPIIKENSRMGTLVILHDVSREKKIEKMKTEFVSIAAHQLRTPLSAIKWTLKMLLDGDLGDISPDQKSFIQKTYIGNERMIRLINDLLNVTRIEEGRYIYKPVPADMQEMMEEVIKGLEKPLKDKKIRFEFVKPEQRLPKVKVDTEKIKLAFNNLLDNAIKYTPEGGIVIVSLKRTDQGIEVKVSDTGMGIQKDQQDRIFSKFFRSANAIREETEGNGLGLYIVKNIIEAHKGKIWFESTEGKGTTFYFTLPVKKEFEEFLKRF